jgi:translation elongation factor EF-4
LNHSLKQPFSKALNTQRRTVEKARLLVNESGVEAIRAWQDMKPMIYEEVLPWYEKWIEALRGLCDPIPMNGLCVEVRRTNALAKTFRLWPGFLCLVVEVLVLGVQVAFHRAHREVRWLAEELSGLIRSVLYESGEEE